MRVDWILDQNEGKLFLQNMIRCENPELYNNKAIIILINYLFSKFKFKILQKRLPLYAGQLGSFLLAVCLDDRITSDGYVFSANYVFLLLGFWLLMVVVTANLGVMLF